MEREEGGKREGRKGGGKEGERTHASRAEKYLSFGRQIFHAVRFEEGEVNHGLEQRDSLLRVASLAQEVALLKKECCQQGAKGKKPG